MGPKSVRLTNAPPSLHARSLLAYSKFVFTLCTRRPRGWHGVLRMHGGRS